VFQSKKVCPAFTKVGLKLEKAVNAVGEFAVSLPNTVSEVLAFSEKVTVR
jgi:hypothetical protein